MFVNLEFGKILPEKYRTTLTWNVDVHLYSRDSIIKLQSLIHTNYQLHVRKMYSVMRGFDVDMQTIG